MGAGCVGCVLVARALGLIGIDQKTVESDQPNGARGRGGADTVRVLGVPGVEQWFLVHAALAVAAVAVLVWRKPCRASSWLGVAWPFSAPVAAAIAMGLMVVPTVGVSLVDALMAATGQASTAHVDELRMAAGVCAQLIAIACVWRWRAARLGVTPRSAGLRADRAVLAGVVGLLLTWPILQLLGAVAGWMQQFLTQTAPPAVGHDQLERMISGSKDAWFMLSAGLAIVAAPLAEECLWRGACQQAVKAAGVPAAGAVWITAVFFALAHWPVLSPGAEAGGLVALTVLGVALGVLAEKSGGIVAPFVAHALFNAANLSMALAQSQPSGSPTP